MHILPCRLFSFQSDFARHSYKKAIPFLYIVLVFLLFAYASNQTRFKLNVNFLLQLLTLGWKKAIIIY